MNEHERLDLEEIRALIRLAAEADLAELEVAVPHLTVKIKKAPGTAAVTHVAGAASPPAADDAAGAAGRPAAPEGRYAPIASPMVGTFYRAPKPDAPAFVQEGDAVEVGQTVCVLEAMKLFNEIPSDVAGRIVRVLVENGAAVEYGQPLFLVDPAST